jgi:zinc protease
MESLMRRFALLALLCLFAAGPASAAANVERVVSPGGIVAWLVRATTNPLVSVEFAFRGGAAQDAAGKEGLANFLATLLDEGAGELDARAFQERAEQLSTQLSFSASRDHVAGSFRTLSVNRDAGFDLLRLALTEPRFDAEAIERMRAAVGAQIRREETQPQSIASRMFSEAAFPNHPYGRRLRGTLETLGRLTRDDLVAVHRRMFARDGLIVAVVGDIDAATLAPLLDRVFGGLPERGERTPIPQVRLANAGARRIAELDSAQTVMQFGVPGMLRSDPDFIPAFVMNHVLGGGSFSSRLWHEVRETRGLTYSIGTSLFSLQASGALVGSGSTRNDRAGEALAIIEAELARMGAEGPTEEELERAKSYLVGSYLLRFETSAQIAQQLLAIQIDDLGIDYIDRRNDLVRAVTVADVRRTAQRLLRTPPLVVLVGRPQGVAPRPGG